MWAQPARSDLLAARAYLHARSPGAARAFAARIREAVNRLGELPAMGAPLEAAPLVGEFRSVVVGDHRVIYRLDPDRVVIFRIWDCRRDPARMWDP